MKNPTLIEALDRMVYLTGNQGIYYRGTQETAANSNTLWNPETFLAIAQQVTHCSLFLYAHIHSPLWKNASFMSPNS